MIMRVDEYILLAKPSWTAASGEIALVATSIGLQASDAVPEPVVARAVN